MKVKLMRYLKPYAPYVILAPLMMLLEVFMDLMQPALMATVVDDGILGGDMNTIITTSVKMLGAALLGMAGGFGCTVFAMLASMNYSADLRGDLFRKVGHFSFKEIDRFSTGSLVTRLTNDVVQLQNLVGMALRMFIRAPLLCVGGVVMAVSISVRYGVILLVCIPVILLMVLVVYKLVFPVFASMQAKLDKLNAVLQENLAGVRVIKAYVRGGFEEKRFGDANEDLTNTALYAMNIMAVVGPIMMLLMNAVVLVVIYMGGLQIQAKEIQVGEVMAGISYMTQILFSFMMMSMMFAMVPRAKVSADRVREVLQTESAITDGEVTAEVERGEIEFDNVSFSYNDDKDDYVLKNVSLKINAGENIGLLGSTGAGKSSLVGLIPRFYDATGGRVLVDGVDVRDYKLQSLRSNIGVVLQEAVLFSGTLAENIRWGKEDASDDEVKQAAAAAQADEYISEMTDGYEAMLGQKGLTLSGGQKQRACIARALIKQPKILIMDDSTSALDLGTESRLNAAIREGYTSGTRITIAQRIASVMDTDRIYVIHDGEVAAVGTHDELLENSEIYRDIYDSQMGLGAVAGE
uniref:ABC transporter-like protein n=1 Tax=uncultured bacterium contig00025 TaxID=1181514 RepID=A0A806KJP4_9BACT|nr:ABC transporter-like protein [uncultured bacterium contig00025]